MSCYVHENVLPFQKEELIFGWKVKSLIHSPTSWLFVYFIQRNLRVPKSLLQFKYMSMLLVSFTYAYLNIFRLWKATFGSIALKVIFCNIFCYNQFKNLGYLNGDAMPIVRENGQCRIERFLAVANKGLQLGIPKYFCLKAASERHFIAAW